MSGIARNASRSNSNGLSVPRALAWQACAAASTSRAVALRGFQQRVGAETEHAGIPQMVADSRYSSAVSRSGFSTKAATSRSCPLDAAAAGRTAPLPPLAGEGWDGGRSYQMTPRPQAAPAPLPPLAGEDGWGRYQMTRPQAALSPLAGDDGGNLQSIEPHPDIPKPGFRLRRRDAERDQPAVPRERGRAQRVGHECIDVADQVIGRQHQQDRVGGESFSDACSAASTTAGAVLRPAGSSRNGRRSRSALG